MNPIPRKEELLNLNNKIEYFLSDCIAHLSVLPIEGRGEKSIQSIADNYFASHGFKTIGDGWNEMDLAEGKATLKFTLESSLFFQEDFMDTQQAEAIANEMLTWVKSPEGFLATGLVDFERRELKESPVFLPPPYHEDYNLGLVLYSQTQLLVWVVRYPVIY